MARGWRRSRIIDGDVVHFPIVGVVTLVEEREGHGGIAIVGGQVDSHDTTSSGAGILGPNFGSIDGNRVLHGPGRIGVGVDPAQLSVCGPGQVGG